MPRWILLAALVAVATFALALLQLPTPALFGSLLGALVYALMLPKQPLKLPPVLFQGGQAVVGVIVGASISFSNLASLGTSWFLVVLVSCFSLVVSVLSGRLLLRYGVSPATATFSSIAGGAAGLTAMADELGADSRVVAVLQYLRLLVVLVTMPLVLALVFHAKVSPSPAETGDQVWRSLLLVAVALPLGLLLGKVAHFPSSAILGPLAVTAALAALPFFRGASVPPIIETVGYIAIGVQVGLRFTVASLKSIGRMLPAALFTIFVTLVACAGLGWVLVLTTGVSELDAYLATTPGGIYAVMGTSASTGGDVGFVAAAQVIRLLIVLASAPFVAAYLRRFDKP